MHEFGDFIGMLGLFGGISLIILAKSKARVEQIKAERQMWQQPTLQSMPAPNDTSVAAELRALRDQVAEMQSTGHQFDLSFDAALNRLEGRVDRLETKSAASRATPNTADPSQSLHNGTAP
jgi:hypothetical protein